MSVVQQAIQHRRCNHYVAHQFAPVGEKLVAGQDNAYACFIPRAHLYETKSSAACRSNCHVADFIYNGCLFEDKPSFCGSSFPVCSAFFTNRQSVAAMSHNKLSGQLSALAWTNQRLNVFCQRPVAPAGLRFLSLPQMPTWIVP